MRPRTSMLVLLITVLVSACDFWPKNLEPLADSIGEQTSGKATAWRVGGDVVVISVENSPLFRASQTGLEARATEIAKQTIDFIDAGLESIAITFYQGEVTEAPDKIREFIFLVRDNQPDLQPYLDLNATGPLTAEELEAAIDLLGDAIPDDQRECVLTELEILAGEAGDPETLDPETVEFLPAGNWGLLDAFGKRLILTQAITTRAMFDCAKQIPPPESPSETG